MEPIESDFIHLEATSPQHLIIPAYVRMVFAMLFSDILGILTAVVLAGTLRWLFIGPLMPDSYFWVPPYLAVYILAIASGGLYPGTGLSAVDQFRHLVTVNSLLTLIIIAVTFFFKTSGEFSRLLLGLTWLLSLIIVPFNRTVIRHLIAKAGLWGEPVAVIGIAPQVESITKYFSLYPKIGLKPQVTLALPRRISDLNAAQRQDIIEHTRKLNAVSPIRKALVAYNQMDELSAIRGIFRDLFERVVLVNITDFGVVLGGVTVRQYGRMLTFEIRQSLMNRTAKFQKRLIDICAAGLGMIVLSPLFGILTILIALDSPGGVFYHQRRLGKGGTEFDILKFRTMRLDADFVLQSHLAQKSELQQEWDFYQKLKNDPRITRVGRLLRRYSLDELPQLWNVLMGEMSLVGPRPIMVNQRELYGENYQNYIRVAPGITGLWQISGRNHTSFAERTVLDIEYVNSWSIWMDIHIILHTIWVVLRRDGAC